MDNFNDIILRLDHVTYHYGAGTAFEKVALDDVNVNIHSGCITGIIGHTGSGKSTLVQLFNGLTKPAKGCIYFHDYNIASTLNDVYDQWKELPKYKDLRKGKAKKAMRAEIKKRASTLCYHIGLVMQYPEYQLFEETVYKDIAFGPKNMDLPEDEIQKRVLEAAKFTDVSEEMLQKSPFDLSGGQKRRVALAGIIAMKPEVLVLDEPAAGLDPRGRKMIFEGLKAYQRATGSTVIIVSHSMEDMAKYADYCVVLSQGKVMREGTKEEVFAHINEFTETGLDIPQITKMMRYLRQNGLNVPDNIYTVEDAIAALKQVRKGDMS